MKETGKLIGNVDEEGKNDEGGWWWKKTKSATFTAV
jgi:hypothetical protein